MVEFVKLNGTAVRVTGFYRQTPEADDGAALEEIELVVVLRGAATHRAFLALLEREPIHLDIPDEREFDAILVSSTWTASGEGDASAYRHDLTLREQPSSEEVAASADEEITTVEEAALADDETGEVPLEDSRPEESRIKPEPNTLPQPDAVDAASVVRIGLRLEALIEVLAHAGLVETDVVNAAFDRLVAERFDIESG